MFSQGLAEQLYRALEEDQELQYLSQKACFSFLWRVDEQGMLFRINQGQIRLRLLLSFNDSWDFTIQGCKQSWNEYFRPIPQPFYHDLFAMIIRVDDVSLEGNRLKAMQHISCLARIFAVIQNFYRQRGGI